jgi:hypothetical protein
VRLNRDIFTNVEGVDSGRHDVEVCCEVDDTAATQFDANDNNHHGS